MPGSTRGMSLLAYLIILFFTGLIGARVNGTRA
jgi:hypothetical protein